MHQKIAERLREERLRLGLSQDEIAKLGGVTGRSQRNYESGARLPDAAYLSAVGVHPGVDLQFVLTGVRYEAETWAVRNLLLLLCEQMEIDLDLVEKVAVEAEKLMLASMAPEHNTNAQDSDRAWRILADKLFSASHLVGAVSSAGIDQDRLSEVLESVEQAALSVQMTARKKAQAVVVIYLASQAIGKVDTEFVKSAIRLAS